MNLKDASVVITGSTRGFGRATAQVLHDRGARVVVSGRRQEDVDRVLAELGEPVGGLACDVSDVDQVYALSRFAVERNGRIDVWINNAGVSPLPGAVLDLPPETAEAVFRVNCLGTLHGTHAAMHHMRQQGSGTIVNLYGRGSDLRPASPSGLYGATKAWITAFTRTMAAEYADIPVRIIGFSPGMMTTDMLAVDQIVGQRIAETMRRFPMALEALGTPPEVPAVELVDLLVRSEKRFVEYRQMRGLRKARMLLRLIWMGMNKRARPPEATFEVLPPYEPPLDRDLP